MRVLHVAEPTTGGVRTYLERIARQQAAAGLEVTVLQPTGATHADAVAVRPWPIERSQALTYVGALRALHDTVRTVQPDVVHLHSFVAGVAGRLPRRRPPQHATVFQPHAWATDRFRGVLPAVVRRWELSASERTDVLVTNCGDEVEQGCSLGITTPAVAVGVPVNVEHFRPPDARERQDARRAVGFTSRNVVLVAGRLGYQKGQDAIVREWERSPIAAADLVLLGDGDPGSLARSAPREWGRSIRHVGSTDDIRSWLWAADVVAVPSRYETMCMVVAEALAVGRSVVTTRFNGALPTILADGAPTGHVVAQGDMRGLLDACRERLADPDAFAHERANGPARVARHLTVEAVTRRLDRAYALAVAARRGG